MPMTIGPRQMTGDCSSRKKPIDMHLTPVALDRQDALAPPSTCGRSSVPNMIGTLGP